MSETLIAFHGKPAIKRKYLSRVRAHAKADEIIHGTYWQDGKGCGIGCTIHSNEHKRYETELGIPEWLAQLEDSMFETLSNGESKSFPAEFLAAIPVGANLEPVKWRFCAFLMRENIERMLKLTMDEAVKKRVVDAIRQVLAYHESAATRKSPDEAAWSAARSAAWSAAESAARSAAESAAWSAAESAARSAAWSAAESAAESAAWSARSAAESAAWSARSAAIIRYKDELLRLLKEA